TCFFSDIIVTPSSPSQDSMFERMQCHTVAEQQACMQDERVFLGDFLQLDAGHAATVEYLQQVARVRMGLDRAADLLVHMLSAAATGSQEESPNGVAAFLTSVVELCRRSGNDWYRVYLIRKICSQRGVEFVQKLLKVADIRWLFPAEVLQQNEDGSQIDQYLVCGEDYKTIRDAVAKAMMEGKIEGLDNACEVLL
ncbi:unnamed protein product, partial [Oncorhynchus mykiss]